MEAHNGQPKHFHPIPEKERAPVGRSFDVLILPVDLAAEAVAHRDQAWHCFVGYRNGCRHDGFDDRWRVVEAHATANAHGKGHQALTCNSADDAHQDDCARHNATQRTLCPVLEGVPYIVELGATAARQCEVRGHQNNDACQYQATSDQMLLFDLCHEIALAQGNQLVVCECAHA